MEEKTGDTKKMTLQDVLEYGKAKGMNDEALAKLEETYREVLQEQKELSGDEQSSRSPVTP